MQLAAAGLGTGGFPSALLLSSRTAALLHLGRQLASPEQHPPCAATTAGATATVGAAHRADATTTAAVPVNSSTGASTNAYARRHFDRRDRLLHVRERRHHAGQNRHDACSHAQTPRCRHPCATNARLVTVPTVKLLVLVATTWLVDKHPRLARRLKLIIHHERLVANHQRQGPIAPRDNVRVALSGHIGH